MTTTCRAFLPPPSRASMPRRHYTKIYSSLKQATPLDSLTVKELKQRVRDSPNAHRGTLSKLKKKQDLIDYLSTQEEASETFSSPDTDESQSAAASIKPKKVPLGMPPILDDNVEENETVNGENDDDGNNGASMQSAPRLSPRDAAFEQVYQRYPSLRDFSLAETIPPQEDIRQLEHPVFSDANVTSDMDIVFVGTASCSPSTTRGVSCTALRLNWKRRSSIWNPDTNKIEAVEGFQGGTWLFDVGECTQLQIQRTPSVRPSKISKIFVTHAHGDHSFGLPGLLCLMGVDRDRNSPPVEIYGPQGLRMWLRVAIRYSVSRIIPPYRVHEIMDVPMAPEWEYVPRARRYYYRGRPPGNMNLWGSKGLAGEDNLSWISMANHMPLGPSYLFGEIDGGRDIYPQYGHPLSHDGAPVWEIEDEEDVKVYAAPMSHGIPCVGYVVEEQPRPGRLRNELVEPIVKRNFKALASAGFRVPMKAMAVIKNLGQGESFTFPDGTVVTQEEAVEPQRKGRKVVVCGDTCDSRALSRLALDADVLVHEATNAYLPGIDKDTDLRAVTKDAVVHGHSTPQIAGRFAQQIRARKLILNHFSSRYKGDLSLNSLSVMLRIENIAAMASGLEESKVAASWDLMNLPITAH